MLLIKKTQKAQLNGMKSAYVELMKTPSYALKKSLYDCYNKPSYNKAYAFSYCMNLFKRYQGKIYAITSYNIFTFTFTFVGIYEGKEAIFYITKSYDKVAFIEDLGL